MATGSGGEMVRRAAFFPRRGAAAMAASCSGLGPAAGGALTAVGPGRLVAAAVASERRVRRSSFGCGGRPSRAAGTGPVPSSAGRWGTSVAAWVSSGELVGVPSW